MGSSPREPTGFCDADRALLRIALLAWEDEPRAMSRRGIAETPAASFGFYDGLPAQVAMLADGRTARLLAPIAYVQPSGEQWPVDKGSMLDGASIPKIFWSLIGGPFEGRYRDASIVHDHYCSSRDRPWRAVHRMFYEAMRCSGVAPAKAKIMYYAVYRFGPRWPDGTWTETIAAFQEAPSGDGFALGSLAADAEAIYTHDLSIAEIEALADARAREASVATVEETAEAVASPSALARARLLVVPGGSGDAQDVEAVAAEVALLPDFVMARFERKKIRIVACRGNITDFETDLKGVIPRGWEETGRTWADVPGTFLSQRKRVVIATIADGVGRAVPTKASGLHGSASLVVHESLHGYDYSRDHVVLADPQFLAARSGDLSQLGSYEKQAGQPGLEETFAESGARFVADRVAMAASWTHLCDYWQSDSAALGTAAAEAIELESIARPEPGDGTLGTAKLAGDGTILLDLRAEVPGEAIGHALLRVRPDEPAYPALRDRLFPAEEGIGTPHGPVPYRPAEAR